MTSTETVLTDEDLNSIRSVFNLIPKAVYGGDKANTPSSTTDENVVGKKSRVSKKKKTSKNTQSSRKDMGRDQENSAEHAALHKKLQEKINEKRLNRKADDETKIEIRAYRKRKREEKKEEKAKEVKRLRREKKKQGLNNEEVEGTIPRHKQSSESHDGSEAEVPLASKETDTLETTRLAGFVGEGKRKKVKRRKLSGGKLRELQIQLEKATKERELKEGNKMNSVKNIPGSRNMKTQGTKEPGVDATLDIEMDKALQRVTGTAVKDDVKKLKKSIRKERRKTEKSKEEWAKRVEALEKEKVAKQERRTKNLMNRKESKDKSNKGKSSKKSGKKHRK